MLAYIQNISCISPLGDWKTTWNGLLKGTSHKKYYSGFHSDFSTTSMVSYMDALSSKIVDFEDIQVGRACEIAFQCLNPLLEKSKKSDPLWLYGGSTHSEADLMLKLNKVLASKPETTLPPRLEKSLHHEIIPVFLSKRFPKRVKIGAWLYASCTSSLHALILALCESRSTLSKKVVFGVDAINDIEVSGFAKAQGCTQNQCRPFHPARDGILISEGAAAVQISDTKEDASGCGILGFGMSCDAGNPTRPDRNGKGLKSCIIQAMAMANMIDEDIGAIILHGTGTKANDIVEATVINELFQNKVVVTSIKGTLGHTMGAAGLFNLLVGYSSLSEGVLPPTSNTSYVPIQEINLVTGAPQEIDASKSVLVLSSGFGGNNVAIIISNG